MSPLLLYKLSSLFLLALAVFFSAAETAFMAINRTGLKFRAESGDRQAEEIKRIVSIRVRTSAPRLQPKVSR